MSLRIGKPGIQTTIQGARRLGWRHMGMPWAGAADSVSLGLANRLVGNASDAAGLEITYGGLEAIAERDLTIGVAGASADVQIEGQLVSMHRTLELISGQTLKIGPAASGARVYLALAGGVAAASVMGSSSTYLPAELGGLQGRALQAGDEIKLFTDGGCSDVVETPDELRPVFGSSFALRTGLSAESELLSAASRVDLFSKPFIAGRNSNRMGVRLEGQSLQIASSGLMKSAPVFPGMIQCPENGEPVILLADAQTTGGYPRIAAVARADRHLLGQVRPGAQVRLLKRDTDQLIEAYRQKSALLRTWMPDFHLS